MIFTKKIITAYRHNWNFGHCHLRL